MKLAALFTRTGFYKIGLNLVLLVRGSADLFVHSVPVPAFLAVSWLALFGSVQLFGEQFCACCVFFVG